MRGAKLLVGLFTIGATMGSLSACSRSNTAYGELAPASAITVHVQNQNFLDMDVYAVSSGLATRLGTVAGSNSRTFMVDPSMAAQDFRIVATPIGGNGRASTGSILASPGQTVEFRIGSTLNNSSFYIK